MRGNERQVLKIIGEMGEADGESLAIKLNVSAKYVRQICSVLIKDGYLEEKPKDNYKLTPKGKRIISPIRTTGPIPILKGGG